MLVYRYCSVLVIMLTLMLEGATGRELTTPPTVFVFAFGPPRAQAEGATTPHPAVTQQTDPLTGFFLQLHGSHRLPAEVGSGLQLLSSPRYYQPKRADWAVPPSSGGAAKGIAFDGRIAAVTKGEDSNGRP